MMKLLIVDDETMARNHIRQNFPWAEWGIEIIGEAVNGADALTFCESNLPDLMLIDITMPVMDGIELLKQIKARWPLTQCIMLTAHRTFEYARQAVQFGSAGYLLKSPIDVQETKAVIDRACQAYIKLAALEKTEKQQRSLLSHYRYPLRRNLLGQIKSGYIQERDVVKEAESVGVKIRNVSYLMMIGQVDHPGLLLSQYPEKDRDLVEFSLLEIVKESLAGSLSGIIEVLPDTFGRCLVLCERGDGNEGWRTEESALSLLSGAIAQLNQTLNQLMKRTISFVVSLNPVAPHHLREKYRRFTPYCEHFFYSKDAALIVVEKAPAFQQLPDKSFAPLSEQFAVLAQEKDLQQLDGWLKRVQQFALTYKPHPSLMRSWLQSLTASASHRFAPDQLGSMLQQLREWLLDLWKAENGLIQVRPEIAKAMSYINDHLREELPLQTIGDHVQLSPTYLGRIFKKETGISIVDYIWEQRIFAAKRLMHETALRSYEIAESVGFNNYSYFCTMFKKIMKQSPNEYRHAIKTSVRSE